MLISKIICKHNKIKKFHQYSNKFRLTFLSAIYILINTAVNKNLKTPMFFGKNKIKTNNKTIKNCENNKIIFYYS